ncbi:hypothetical protein J2S03_000065 [Alicyclobacillus cycloheptanicus]|uniref:Uncharacterized protein n=1 Tax=Alicyclobacillus cycloheptanicus TaxID=1457 RepID=A0ABT9XD87_9BACL|nr:hypothetical protein [Alicyclobacillus cycloheptanicus]
MMTEGARLIYTFESESGPTYVYAAPPDYTTEEERREQVRQFHKRLAELLIKDKQIQIQKDKQQLSAG